MAGTKDKAGIVMREKGTSLKLKVSEAEGRKMPLPEEYVARFWRWGDAAGGLFFPTCSLETRSQFKEMKRVYSEIW